MQQFDYAVSVEAGNAASGVEAFQVPNANMRRHHRTGTGAVVVIEPVGDDAVQLFIRKP